MDLLFRFFFFFFFLFCFVLLLLLNPAVIYSSDFFKILLKYFTKVNGYTWKIKPQFATRDTVCRPDGASLVFDTFQGVGEDKASLKERFRFFR